MQYFVRGLGLVDKGGCSYCHVEDRADDEKMQKLIARNMGSPWCVKSTRVSRTASST
jgi:hypothetical protein